MKATLPSLHGARHLWPVLLFPCMAASLNAQQPPPGYAYPPPPAYGQPPQYQAPAYPQQQYSPPPQYAPPPPQTEYVSPVEFLPTFGRKFGNMFRKVFYGDSAPAEYPMPGSSSPQSSGRGNLDSAPPAYGSYEAAPPQGGYPQRYREVPVYPPQPQYSAPPQPQYSAPPQPQYQQPPAYAAPQPQQPAAAPRYETPPAPRNQLPPSSNGRMGTSQPPRMSVKPSSEASRKSTASSSKTQSSTTRKYTPPTLSSKPKPALEEMPPPADSGSSSADEDTGIYPLPGANQAASAKTKSQEKPKSQSTAETKTNSSNNNKPASSGGFLKGKRTNKPGRVISPYPPYQELDVTGLGSGSLAMDPTTQKVFEVP